MLTLALSYRYYRITWICNICTISDLVSHCEWSSSSNFHECWGGKVVCLWGWLFSCNRWQTWTKSLKMMMMHWLIVYLSLTKCLHITVGPICKILLGFQQKSYQKFVTTLEKSHIMLLSEYPLLGHSVKKYDYLL